METNMMPPLLFYKFYLSNFNLINFTIDNDTYLMHLAICNHVDTNESYELYHDIIAMFEKSQWDLYHCAKHFECHIISQRPFLSSSSFSVKRPLCTMGYYFESKRSDTNVMFKRTASIIHSPRFIFSKFYCSSDTLVWV